VDLTAWLPLFACVVSLFFAGHLAAEWSKSHRAYYIWWSVAIGLYAVSAGIEFYALAYGLTSALLKVYYFAAMSLVGFMAVGEAFLLTRHVVARVFMAAMLLLAAMLAYRLATLGTVPLHGREHMLGADNVAVLLPMSTRIWGIVQSAAGGVLLIAGPLWSWWKTRRLAALWIAAGALVLSGAGSLAGLGHPALLPFSELAGVALMYYGVLAGAKASRGK
jgi:hypothetical protein